MAAMAKQIICTALMATLEAGDEVILPAPYFVSCPEMVKLLGGTPVVVECPDAAGFRLTPKALEQAITPRTKWLFLNMPGNPSGAVCSEAALKALGAVLARHPQVLVLTVHHEAAYISRCRRCACAPRPVGSPRLRSTR